MFLPAGSGYRDLRVYHLSEIIYDLTDYFVQKDIEYGSRTKDLLQATSQYRKKK